MPTTEEIKASKPWPVVNIRLRKEVKRGMRVAAIRLQVSLGDYVVQLFAFGQARGFPACVKPVVVARRPPRENFPIRMPSNIAREMRAVAKENGLKLGSFTEGLFSYAQANHFDTWLDSIIG